MSIIHTNSSLLEPVEFIIASRRSDLARLQSLLVKKALTQVSTNISVTFRCIFSEAPGDTNQETPLWNMSTVGVFTDYLRCQLLNGDVDLVVHSWKDIPIPEDNRLTYIAATLPREDPRDVLLLKIQRNGKESIKVLTSSPRRAYNLQKFITSGILPLVNSVEFLDVRGNIFTRLRKLIEGDADGLVCAAAALSRLQWASRAAGYPGFEDFELNHNISPLVDQVHLIFMPLSISPCAAGQGALAIEVRAKDVPSKRHTNEAKLYLLSLLELINHADTFESVEKERAILRSYGGGCSQKIGCTILKRPYGDIKFLRGISFEGKELSISKVMSTSISENLRLADLVTNKKLLLFVGGAHLSEKSLIDSCRISLFTRDFFDKTLVSDSIIRYITDLVDNYSSVYENSSITPEYVHRVSLPINILITKGCALPECEFLYDFLRDKICKNQINIWTSGIALWKKIANLGLIVTGSSHLLSETDIYQPNLSYTSDNSQRCFLCDTSLCVWVKLTHENADIDKSGFASKFVPSCDRHVSVNLPSYTSIKETVHSPRQIDASIVTVNIPTYRLVSVYADMLDIRNRAFDIFNMFASATHIFWSSGSSFIEALRLDPNLLSRVKLHGVGPGSTRAVVSDRCNGNAEIVVLIGPEDFLETTSKSEDSIDKPEFRSL